MVGRGSRSTEVADAFIGIRLSTPYFALPSTKTRCSHQESMVSALSAKCGVRLLLETRRQSHLSWRRLIDAVFHAHVDSVLVERVEYDIAVDLRA